MSTENTMKANAALLGTTEPVTPKPAERKFGGTKSRQAPQAAKAQIAEEELEKKHSFSSTITTENKRRFANYQANKPGRKGTATTDVLNAALTMFFDANKKYADVDPGNDD